MAEAAMTYVLRKLGDALLKKAQELHDVRGQMEQMKQELGFIKAYLRDADSKQHKGNELVKEWVNSVRDMAYKIEDVIDTFLVEIEEKYPKSNSRLSKMLPVVKHPKLMNKLSAELKEITHNLNMIYQHGTDLGIKDLCAGNSEEPFRPTKPSEIDDSEVVGLEADKRQILKQLLNENISRRTVLSIVGTGGLGKTTLGQKVYKRCLIQVTEKSWNGCCKYCNMHDLLRDLAIREAEEDNFFTVFSKVEDCNNIAARKPRRAALHFCTLTKDGVYSVNTRSLLFFAFGQYSSSNNGFILQNYSGFRLLSVLTIEHVDMGKFNGSKWLKDMTHMRYLGFRYCSVGQKILERNSFYNLETIDLTESTIGKFTQKTTNHVVIPTLRRVYGNQHLEKICPLKWDHLTNLQTLKSVGHTEVPYLGGCINLRTFGVHYWIHERSHIDKLRTINFVEEWETLKGVLKTTKQLVSLRIVTTFIKGFFVPFGGTRYLPCHEKIQSLYLAGELGGPICVPNVEMFPTNLTKLRLQDSMLRKNPMPIFEMLRNLRILQLRQYSYYGTELICSTRGVT